jgi:gamma-glutamylaminecyclotransferase
MAHRVFVYGSLMSGLHNHHMLDGARRVGRGTTGPHYRMVSLGGFPAVLAGGSSAVAGELYEVPGRVLGRLDRLEGHPDWYRRTPCDVRLDDGTAVEAEMYVMTGHAYDGRDPVPGGDWRAHAPAWAAS